MHPFLSACIQGSSGSQLENSVFSNATLFSYLFWQHGDGVQRFTQCCVFEKIMGRSPFLKLTVPCVLHIRIHICCRFISFPEVPFVSWIWASLPNKWSEIRSFIFIFFLFLFFFCKTFIFFLEFSPRTPLINEQFFQWAVRTLDNSCGSETDGWLATYQVQDEWDEWNFY